MLAYIFWHWPVAQVEPATYQELLGDFHRTLDGNRPVGFRYSRVLLSRRAPWAERDAAATYEDWYIVENSAALDILDQAAVSGPCLPPHNQVARLADGGTGGLYRLRSGDADMPEIRCAYWFNKPAGMSYPALYELIQPLVEREGIALWQRQMTLGPATEFCLHSAVELSVPASVAVMPASVQQTWH
jgi:hypothetical protein